MTGSYQKARDIFLTSLQPVWRRSEFRKFALALTGSVRDWSSKPIQIFGAQPQAEARPIHALQIGEHHQPGASSP